MLSIKNSERVKKQIEKSYNSVCSIIEDIEIINENGSSSFIEKVIIENQPCKVSFSKRVREFRATKKNKIFSSINQEVVLFISPLIRIKAGSKIVVISNNQEYLYNCSGKPIVYDTHQEVGIVLNEICA